MIPSNHELVKRILHEFHTSLIGGQFKGGHKYTTHSSELRSYTYIHQLQFKGPQLLSNEIIHTRSLHLKNDQSHDFFMASIKLLKIYLAGIFCNVSRYILYPTSKHSLHFDTTMFRDLISFFFFLDRPGI